MTDQTPANRPRTFLWLTYNGIAWPQIWFDDPRVGCREGSTPIPGTEVKLDPSDTRTLEQLAADYPAPKETV